MKVSNTLLFATATASLAMIAAPADAFSFANIRLPPWLEEKYAHLKQPRSMTVKNIPVVKNTGASGRTIKEYAPRWFATGDAPSAVGSPTNAGTPGPSSPMTRPRRSGHRRRHPRQRNRVRRSSSPGRRRRRHRRPGQGHAHGHGPSQGRAHGHRHSRGHRRGHPHRRRPRPAHGKPTTSTPAQVPTSATTPITGSAAASHADMSPRSYDFQSMEPVRRGYPNRYVSDLARFEQIKARHNRMSTIKHAAKHSLADGYDYEPFDDEYDEGFSISEDAAFGDDDAWEDNYEGDFSVSEDAWEDE
ncbi:hypothetical protein AMAG_00945 [Allomyces macrogynus ATCC 38327]|uniref:Uncharacterized protein n=1 Tax=Allomyces macrogynus (strain ATCC 38327) TaxID=578462 RepID=A0A0L0RXG4_ALLM3|nr:hypothetical protein AMAG_00945 [Allomyces macrogynus ATCC 38327]|eukprot:KNE55008.1 hypothetical protein AMAG_00945 [Allomyces macrogynus ATCC 38327]